jgi:outer membrane beta-barrel protein
MVRLTSLLLTLVFPTLVLAQHEEEVAPLMAEYWARKAVAVQPRRHQKARALELVAHVGVIPNDAFLVYIPVGARVAYHLTESWALEASFGYNLQVDTGLRDYLEDNDAQLRARLRDRQQLSASAGLGWSPVYGKVALGAGTIVHFDGYLMAGGGIVRTEEEAAIELDAATRPDFFSGLGLRVFFGSRWLTRLEYRQHIFLRPTDNTGGGGGVGFPSEISVGVGVLLGGTRS